MIVMEYRTPEGVHIKFNDDAYAGKTADEKESARKAVDMAAAQIILRRAKGE